MSRSWKQKFADAFHGLWEGVRDGASIRVHALVAVVVIALAAALRMNAVEWSIVLLCIAGVFSAELFNTALEAMARAITRDTNPHIRNALDIAAGAVLMAVFGAMAVGAVVFAHRAGRVAGLW